MKVAGWFICTDEHGKTIATLENYGWARINRTKDAVDLVVRHCSGESQAAVPMEVIEELMKADRSVSKP